METGTLDFDDLMDTGDEYPGFEIAKFTPASGKDDDSILRTPEHQNEEEEDDGSSNSASNDVSETREPADQPAKRQHEDTKREPKEDLNNEISPAKKKKYLLPPKPKMKLWEKKSDKEKESNQDSASRDQDRSPSKQNGDSDSNNSQSGADEREKVRQMKKPPPGDDKDEEEDPHQQSFLSFFNLKPGSGGASEPPVKKDIKGKEADFYSRKRLRIRKKVSYVEDVVDDNDEEYVEEEEDMEDHMLQIRRRRNSSGTPKRKPVTSPVSAAANYAQALQSISVKTSKSPSPADMTHQAAQIALALQKQGIAIGSPSSSRVKPSGMSADGVLGSPATAGHIKGLFECGLCGTFFNTASQFIAHQEANHPTENRKGKSGMETFRCEICQFVLTNRFAYLEHKRMKHMKNQVTFSCHKCGRTFGYLLDLQNHKEQCGINSPMCGVCNLKFSSLKELVSHRQRVHSTNSAREWLSCVNKTCKFKCLTQHEMNQHIKTKHMSNEFFSCNANRCGRIFGTRDLLNEHRKEAHASEFIVQYQCMECKLCYSTKTLLAEHQYIHTMDKLRKCDICMRQFTTMSQLKRHKEVHASKGTMQCHSCSRWFVDKQDLLNHMCKEKRTKYSGMLLYFCDICFKDFRTDELMFKHRRVHKNFYQCSTCLMECETEKEYFDHRKTHALYACMECCEELPSESELETHVKAHKFCVKMIQSEFENGRNAPVMYLCPNLTSMIKA